MNSRKVYKHQKIFDRKSDCQTLLMSSGFRRGLKTVQILRVQNQRNVTILYSIAVHKQVENSMG